MLLALLGLPGRAQNPDQLPSTFLPKSPTVTPFQRFDKQENVNLMTGAAQATVPLAELRSGSLQTGVSLAYSFGGLKVVQPPDLVGLGWFLQAGGSISRHVVGRRDEDLGGAGVYSSDTVGANGTNQAFLENAMLGRADAGPDVYDFSVGPYHGRFMLRDTSVILLPAQPVQIRRLTSGAFQLAAETGVRYVFAATEVTTPNPNNFGTLGTHVSAWHLTQIIAAGNTDTIQFHYSTWRYVEPARVGQTTLKELLAVNSTLIYALDQPAQNTWVRGSRIAAKVLDSVTTRGARIILGRDNNHVLQQVRVLSTLQGSRRVVRVMALGHSYFQGLTNQLSERRLRLDWVQEGNGTQRVPTYRFDYDTTVALPPTTSKGQDHWGYYNGADDNGSNNSSAFLVNPKLPASPERGPNFGAAKAGALERITYPTGGYTTIAYEPNSYPVADDHKTIRVTNSYQLSVSGQRPANGVFTNFNLRGVQLIPLPSSLNVVTRFNQSSCTSHRLVITAPTLVRFIIGVYPIHEQEDAGTGREYHNMLPDFMLLKGDTILEQYRANAGTNERDWSETIPPGTYTVWAIAQPDLTGGYVHAESTTVDILTPGDSVIYTPDVQGNGIRVRQVVTATAGGLPLARTYTYQINTPDGPCSSGTMLLPIAPDGAPIYQVKPYTEAGFDNSGNRVTMVYMSYTSDITRFGDEYKKYTFYYSRVSVQEGGSQNGITIHSYRHYPEQFNEVLPMKVETYRNAPAAAAAPQLVQAERYHYKADAEGQMSFYALRPYIWSVCTDRSCSERYLYRADYYELTARFLAPDRTSTVQYGPQGDSVESVTRTLYRQQRPVRVTTRNSDGSQRSSNVAYLSDYAPTLPGFAQLRAHNFNPIVEVQHWRRFAGRPDSVLVGAEATRYDLQWQQPASTWHLDVAQPAVGLNALSLTNGLRTTWLGDTRYRRVATEHYDPATGDPTGQVPASGPATAYVWGYQRTALVAQAQNATAAQVAYAGFEAGELGRWQGAASAIAAPGYTGTAGYNLTAGLTCQGLPPGQYLIRCRRQGTSGSIAANGQALLPTGPAVQGWTAYTTTIAVGTGGLVQLTGSGQVDDVCLHPVGARLTTYTHLPLVGMTSQTDPAGRIVYYEYDALGRLVRTRDEQGRLLSQQAYHYARP